MKYKPYEFNPDDAYRFASFMRIETRVARGQLELKTCPYCGGEGQDNLFKFAISLTNGTFNCFRGGCKQTGNMIRLSRDFDFSLGNEVDEYYAPKKKFKTYKKPEKPIVPKSAAVAYLEKRGISQAIAEKYQITTKTGSDNILVFPFINGKEISLIKYRKIDFDPSRDANKEWSEKGGKPILFGMAQCNMNNDTLITAEGQIDSLSIAEAGIENAVSVPTGANGFTWVPYCWDWMQNFKTIIIFGDHEKGRITLLEDFAKRFKCCIKHVREEDYKDCKDANEILLKYGKEQVRLCVANAVELPVRNTIDLADVEELDVYKMEKLPTGIMQLDRLLKGGLPYGGVHIITGYAGKGKSTLASQILVKAISLGKRCFAYSGELPNNLFRAWMTFQVVGRKHVFEYKNPWGDSGYSISKTNKALASEFYRGMIRVFDSESIVDEETRSLLEITEEMIVRYGAEVILLDNLMTAIEEDRETGDEFTRQGRFVNRLRKLAVKHNVVIMLVAHKRKNGFSMDENSEVSGSSKITNLAMLTISYDNDKDLPDDQRVLKVIKNRLFGKLEKNGFVMSFDEQSKRIYGKGDDLDFDYGWCKGAQDDGFKPIPDDMDNPFV